MRWILGALGATLVLALAGPAPAQVAPDLLEYAIPDNAQRKGPFVDPSGRQVLAYVVPETEELVAREVFEDGARVRRDLFKDGKLHGIQRQWHPNGVLASAEPYRDGWPDGRSQHWDPQGRLVGSYVIQNGAGLRKIYWPNGRVAEQVRFDNGVRDGEEFSFYPNGQAQSLGWRKDAVHVGDNFVFYPNGRLRIWAHFDAEGRLHGPLVYLDEKGGQDEDAPSGFFIHGEKVDAATYAKKAAADDDLSAPESSGADYEKRVTPRIRAIVESFLKAEPVEIPLKEAEGD